MKNVLLALSLLLGACTSINDNWGGGASYDRYFDEKSYCTDCRAIGEVLDRTNLCVFVVNNVREIIAVDVHNLKYSYGIKYRTMNGGMAYMGNIAVTRCGPIEVAFLSPLVHPNRLVMEMASTLSFEVKLPIDCLEIEKVSLEVPLLKWHEFIKLRDADHMETSFADNCKLIQVEIR